jgi:hypothetical protein
MLLRVKKQSLMISSRDVLPKIKENDQPVIVSEDVRKLIKAVKKEGSQKERFYLALSTIYGLRAGEMKIASRKEI